MQRNMIPEEEDNSYKNQSLWHNFLNNSKLKLQFHETQTPIFPEDCNWG